MSQLHSHLYEGWVRHRRYTPKSHAFNYPVFMTWLALDELDQVMALSQFWSLERFNLVSFYRNDYLGGNTGEDLSSSVINRIKEHNGDDFKGRICLLTHLRFLGFCFNPVSFYFCYPEGSESPRYILAEINNTPWNERYCYVLDVEEGASQKNHCTFDFKKAFHVSPFMPMEQQYHWQFSLQESNLTIHMQLQQDNDCCFDATLQLKAKAMTPAEMRNLPLRFPFLTLSVVIAIYWQALRLWLKGIPFYSHPEK
ncbi:MAG: DUF1365 domain-containing protein [Methylococcales bacterium]|nr:MAG: DUF1365 domain-containing protein [Methylococcales bacterium]